MITTTLFLTLVWSIANINTASALSCRDISVNINSQSDINFYSNCTVLEDQVFINHSYSGAFELPGVQSLGMFAAGYYLPRLKGVDRVDDSVTSISMPDLRNATWSKGLYMGYLPNLTSISFPKLESMTGELIVFESYNIRKLSFPSLYNLTGAGLFTGHFDEISLPALKTIRYLRIESTGTLDCVALGKNLSSLAFTPKQYDTYAGFTCWTPNATNFWNSSAPATATSSGSASTGTSGAGTGGSTAAKSAAARGVEFVSLRAALNMLLGGVLAWGLL